MSSHQQNTIDLADAIQRIADGEGYIARMEQLVARATDRSEDVQDLVKYLDSMRLLQVTFKDNRDLLIGAIYAADRKSADAVP